MDKVTADASSDHYSHSHLGEVHHPLVDMFLWQLFPDALHCDFQLVSHISLQLEFMVFFQNGALDVLGHGFKSG